MLRDNLNTLENYKEIIDFNLECISDWRNDIYSLLDDEKKGIQRNPRKNLEVIQYITKDITSRRSIYRYVFCRLPYRAI